MTQEQKAKAYDEAIERAKKWHNAPNADKIPTLSTRIIEEIFPELRESEDERIIRIIEDAICTNEAQELVKAKYGLKLTDLADWLEKQGELKLQGKTALEAIKEEKVDNANKVEPKFKVKYACGEYNVVKEKEIAGVTYYGIEDEPNHIDYVLPDNCEIISDYGIKENGSPYPTKPAMFSEQKPTDEEMKELLRTEYEKGRADAIAETQVGL